jgi:hypothetical protein
MYESSSQQVSFLDKTDWRRTIHKCLENCVYTEGTTKYPSAVESLVSAVSSTFPNWNTRILIDKYINGLDIYYRKTIKNLIENNPDYWVHPGKRILVEPDIINSYYKDIFNYVFDMLADKRMLIWGSKTIPGGSQMEENET